MVFHHLEIDYLVGSIDQNDTHTTAPVEKTQE